MSAYDAPAVFYQIASACGVPLLLVDPPRERHATLPRNAFSVARSAAELGDAAFYVEGLLEMAQFPGVPLGHAWFVNTKGVAVDHTRDAPGDVYYEARRVPAADFVAALEDPAFRKNFELHDMLPYSRALLAMALQR